MIERPPPSDISDGAVKLTALIVTEPLISNIDALLASSAESILKTVALPVKL